MVKAQHCGIDIDFLKDVIKSEEFVREYESLTRIAEEKRVLGSVDRLSPLSGVVEKFAGYVRFLNRNPAFKDKTTLVQVRYFIVIIGI